MAGHLRSLLSPLTVYVRTTWFTLSGSRSTHRPRSPAVLVGSLSQTLCCGVFIAPAPWSERKKLNLYAQALDSKQEGMGNSGKDEGQWEGLAVPAEEREVGLWSGLKGSHQERLDPAPGQLLLRKWLSCGIERLERVVLRVGRYDIRKVGVNQERVSIILK